MRYLLIRALLPLTLIACQPKILQDAQATQAPAPTILNPYFSSTETDYVYKMKMEAYGHFLGGILAVKRTGTNQHRAVLSSEFGARLFDFEFSDNGFKINAIADNLNKKVIITILKQDLRALTQETGSAVTTYARETTEIARSSIQNNWGYYFYSAGTELDSIKFSKNQREQVLIEFLEVKDDVADKISIKHLNKKLKMDLVRLLN